MKNVLLVDDDSIFTMLNTKALERMKFIKDIHTVQNGQQALDFFSEYAQGGRKLPDIILLDLSMPVMDGFEFLEAFSRLELADKERVKIIIVSSSYNPRDINRAKSLGATQYLIKPISEQSLKEALGFIEGKKK